MTTFEDFDIGPFYDKLIDPLGRPRLGAQLLIDRIQILPKGDLIMRQKAAEALLLKMGITFNVHGRDEGTEKIFPFDIIPRIVPDSGLAVDRIGIETADLCPERVYPGYL